MFSISSQSLMEKTQSSGCYDQKSFENMCFFTYVWTIAGRRRWQMPTASIFRFNQEIAVRLANIRFFNWTWISAK